jgi:integrase
MDLIKAKKRIGHRMKCYDMEKWEVLSSHIGRRSFATNFYGKIPTPLLMDATGHSTEQMFLRYINPLDENRILSLSSYFERVYQERMVV